MHDGRKSLPREPKVWRLEAIHDKLRAVEARAQIFGHADVQEHYKMLSEGEKYYNPPPPFTPVIAKPPQPNWLPADLVAFHHMGVGSVLQGFGNVLTICSAVPKRPLESWEFEASLGAC